MAKLIDEETYIRPYAVARECFTRACMYLTRGYIDGTEKDNWSVMDWEDFILKEIVNDCQRIPTSGEED